MKFPLDASNVSGGAPTDGTREKLHADKRGRGHLPWRLDVQALRGLAVIYVIADHAGVPFLMGGFLGVDIFFVISGFLMTKLIVDELDRNEFSILQFYGRRARRLLPAAYATVAITTILSIFILDDYELRNLLGQVIGAFTFTANIVLWKQVDYFNSEASVKPLLHFWSLAVEEQYYLFLPLILVMIARRFRLPACALMAAGSLVLCLYFVGRSPSATFYFLPFRAWEMGFGTITALIKLDVQNLKFRGKATRFLAVAFLVLLPVYGVRGSHPGWSAILVCFSTAWLMISGGAERSNAGVIASLAWVGNRSYTLYLLHWPALSLAHNVFLDSVPPLAILSVLLLVAIVGEAQYRLIERRFRAVPTNRRNVAFLVCAPVGVIFALTMWSYGIADQRVNERAPNLGFSRKCDAGDQFLASPDCQSQPRPDIMIWGDSFAMHLVGAVSGTPGHGVMQATRTACGPFIGIAPLDDGLRKRPWAEQCIRFNASVIDYLKDHAEIKTVVLSSILKQYVVGGENHNWRRLIATPHGFREAEQDASDLESSLRATVELIRASGKKVVFVAPPPSVEFDIGRCLSRLQAQKFTISKYVDCNIPFAEYNARRKPVLALISKLQESNLVDVISFDSYLCSPSTCATQLSGIPLYRDSGHLSQAGARELGKYTGLGDLILSKAR